METQVATNPLNRLTFFQKNKPHEKMILVERCVVCGGSAFRYPNRDGKRKGGDPIPLFCSRKCQGLAKRTRPRSTPCKFCGKIITHLPDKHGIVSQRFFCDNECRKKRTEQIIITRMARKCESCGVDLPTYSKSGKVITCRHSKFCTACRKEIDRKKRKGRVLKRCGSGRSKQNDGYIMLKKSHLASTELAIADLMVGSEQIPEHRLLMAMKIGRPLGKKEVVHHVNGVKHDNRLENLELVEWSIHNRNHKEINREILVLRKRVRELEKLLAKNGIAYQQLLISPSVA